MPKVRSLLHVSLLFMLAGCNDSVLPIEQRTPTNLAAFYGNVHIPENSVVKSKVDDYLQLDPDGAIPPDGVVSVEFDVPKDSMPRLVHEVRKQGYRPIDTASELERKALRASAKRAGLFRFEQGSQIDNQLVIVVDSASSYAWICYGQITQKW